MMQLHKAAVSLPIFDVAADQFQRPPPIFSSRRRGKTPSRLLAQMQNRLKVGIAAKTTASNGLIES